MGVRNMTKVERIMLLREALISELRDLVYSVIKIIKELIKNIESLLKNIKPIFILWKLGLIEEV